MIAGAAMTFFARPAVWTRGQQAEATPFAGGSQHYFAFLSYSHRDEAMAQWLHDELEKFRVPHHLVGRVTEHGPIPRRLTPIFRDLKELPASDDLGVEIRTALTASRFLVVLCSPAAAGSRWTNAEIATYKRVHPDGHILAAIVGGEPFASDKAGREQEECLPVSLRFKYDRRGHQTTKKAEPLAADLRGGADERRVGFLKLVAGMLGVGLDEIIRRDDIRRQRRLAVLASASLAGMIVTSGLAVAAIQARDSARDQRREAEGLVGFMVGDLKDKLEPIGKLDALDGVGARVLAYYEKQDASELPDSALLQRSRALSLTAQVAYLRGDASTAQQLYRNAMRGTAEAIRRSPDDPARLFDHAQNVFWIGELARERSDMGRAEAAYREYKSLADRMVAIEPDNLRWRMEIFYANENLGIVLFNQRRFALAAERFEGSLRPMESLASIDPDNAEYQKELSNVLAWLADAERAQGHLKVATSLRERQVSFLSRLISSGKTNVEFRQQLIPARQALGILLNSTGEVDRGIEQLRMGVDVADRLIPVEPDNVMWKGLAAQAKLELAGMLLSQDRTEEAAAQARSGCDLAGFVHARDPGATWRYLRTTCFTVRSRLALEGGKTSDALRFADAALASARTERSEDSIKDRYSVAAGYRLLGDVQTRMGDGEAARTAWVTGLGQLPANVVERASELNGRLELLRRLNRAGEVRPLAARLEAMGYRNSY